MAPGLPEAAPRPADDEEVSLDELVNLRLSASSFFEVARETAPGASYVISGARLADSAGRTLADHLEMTVPGVQIARHLWTGAVIGVRGITIDNNAKTQVMLDGLNLNMRTHFGTHGLLSVPLLEDVEGLEVSIGPGALVHGAGALNGYVDLRPKDGARHPGFAVTVEAGPVDAHGSAQISYGLTYGTTNNLYLYAGFAGADGFTPRGDRSWSCTGPDQRDNTACPYAFVRARDLGPSGKLSLNWNHGDLNLLGLFVKAQLSTEGNALYDWFNFEDPQWLSTILALRPRYTHALSDSEDLILSGTLVLQDFGFVPRHPRRSDLVGGVPVEINGTARGGRESWESLRAIWRTIRLPMHSLAAGGEVGHRGFSRQKQFFARRELLGLEEVELHWLELAAFVEDTLAWGAFSVTGGLRAEHFEIPRWFQAGTYTEADTKEMVTPRPVALDDQRALVKRLGVAWAASPDLTLKASFQEGFRNPDAAYYTHWAARAAIRERAGRPALPALGNETMDSFELNLNGRVRGALFTGNAYYNRYRGLLAWHESEKAFLNTPEAVQAIGGEAGLDVVTRTTRLSLSYGYSRPLGRLNTADPAWPTGAKAFAPHQLKLGLRETFWNGRLGAHLSAAFFAKVQDPAWAAGQRHRLLVNAAARIALTPQISAKLVLQNLTGNTVPAARIDNGLTQVGNLGIDQRLAYLSLVLTTR